MLSERVHRNTFKHLTFKHVGPSILTRALEEPRNGSIWKHCCVGTSFLISEAFRGWYPLELALKTPPKLIFFRATKVCVLLWLSSHTNGKLAGSYISLFYSTWSLKVLHTTWLIHPFIPTIISLFKCFQSNIHSLISPISATLSLNVQAKTSVLFSSSTFMFLLL